jgi:hypothetical protein
VSGYSSWGSIDIENRQLVSRISDKVDMKCAVFSSNLGVRGYANLLFHRGIYEYKSIQETGGLMTQRKACASVYVEGTWIFWNLPNYTKATITHSDGSTDIVTK